MQDLKCIEDYLKGQPVWTDRFVSTCFIDSLLFSTAEETERIQKTHNSNMSCGVYCCFCFQIDPNRWQTNLGTCWHSFICAEIRCVQTKAARVLCWVHATLVEHFCFVMTLCWPFHFVRGVCVRAEMPWNLKPIAQVPSFFNVNLVFCLRFPKHEDHPMQFNFLFHNLLFLLLYVVVVYVFCSLWNAANGW